MMHRLRILILTLLALVVALPVVSTQAQAAAPLETAETLRSRLVEAQLALSGDAVTAGAKLTDARASYAGSFAAAIKSADSAADARIVAGFDAATAAIGAGDVPAFADARSQVWTGVLAGSYQRVAQALTAGDSAAAQQWLPVRDFRPATRFSRPGANATLAVDAAAAGTATPADALLAVRADLLDTYQAKLAEALHDLAEADAKGFAQRKAEFGSLAAGYFAILAPAYAEQRGADALAAANQAVVALRAAALADQPVDATLETVDGALQGFRAAPLSTEEQARRAGQLLRFLALVPVEYGRGVKNGVVTRELEIQEATTFRDGAAAAFGDLESLLLARDSAKTGQARQLFAQLEQLVATAHAGPAADPAAVQAAADELAGVLKAAMPAAWQQRSVAGDFDVIATMLDEMERAAAAGQYDLAESARLEAYAVLETGPEARLIAFAPQTIPPLEELFWYGQGEHTGLARLIAGQATKGEITASRKALDAELASAQKSLSSSGSPVSVATNASIIVFREGLEAVLILASLMGSLKLGEQRRYRRPLWWGALAAFAASALTWVLMRGVLQQFQRYGERLEAIVSLVAIGVLLLITNWFFHKVYWTGWMANFHTQKKRILGGSAGLTLGLVALGFTSIYREGFETVLFLQALVLEAGNAVVLSGVAVGLAGTIAIGFLVFVLQARLPHKKMLIATGIMIGAVLLGMVGNKVHVLQLVGWLPLHPIRGLQLPYWAGLWFGVFATWEGLALQATAGTFVIGSYFLAERVQHRKARAPQRRAVARNA